MRRKDRNRYSPLLGNFCTSQIAMTETLTSFTYQLVYLFAHLAAADVIDIFLVAATLSLESSRSIDKNRSTSLSGSSCDP